MRNEVNRKGHIMRKNCLLKHVIQRMIEGRIDEEEDVSSYCITLRKRKDTGNCKRDH